MIWTVELLGTRYKMLSGSVVKWVCGEQGKHRTSSMTAVVRGLDLAADLISHNGLIDAVIRRDDDVIFTGVIRPYLTISSKYNQTDELDLEVLDYTEKMHVKILERVEGVEEQEGCIFSETMDGLKICAGEGSLVYKLASKAGVEIASAPTINTVLQRFELKAGEYLDSSISSLLYEYLLDYRFDPSGKMIIYHTSPDAEYSSTVVNFYGDFSIQKKDEPKDGAIVSYDKYMTVSDFQVGTWSDSAFTMAVVGGYNGSFFNAKEKKVIFDLTGLGSKQKSARISQVWATTWSSGPISGTPSVSIDSWDQNGAVISVSGGGWYWAGTINWGVKIYASMTYLYSEKSSVGFTGKDTDSYTASYIQRTEDAVKLVEAIRKRNAAKTVSFNTYEDLGIGDFVRIDEAQVTGLDSKIRITQKTYDVISGLYSYTAETVGTVTIAPPDISTEVETQDPSSDLGAFLEIRADRAQILQEESISDIHISSSGYGLDRYGLAVSFFLNDNSIKSDDGRTLTINKKQLKIGINTIEGVVVYDGNRYVSSISISYIQAGQYSTFEYAVGTSPDTPPEKLETFFTYGDYLIGYDDAIIVLDDTWTKIQPVPAEGEYVWMRMMNQNGEWVVVRLTGVPGADAIDFSLSASPSSFQNSKRRLSDIVVSIGVSKQNMPYDTLFEYSLTGSVPYGVTIDSSGIIRIPPGVHPDELTVKVTAGEPYNIEKSITITGIPAVDSQSQYLGMTATIPPAYSGALLDGDWVMYTGDDGAYSYGHVYKLNGSSWIETTAIKDLFAVQDDATKIINEQGKYVYAKVIFAQSILAVDIAVTGRFIFKSVNNGMISQLEISPDAGLLMKYGSESSLKTVFNADFMSGRVFLGEPDSSKALPQSGFMYDPSNQQITSRGNRIIIESDGSLTTECFKIYPRDEVEKEYTVSGSDAEKFVIIRNIYNNLTNELIYCYFDSANYSNDFFISYESFTKAVPEGFANISRYYFEDWSNGNIYKIEQKIVINISSSTKTVTYTFDSYFSSSFRIKALVYGDPRLVFTNLRTSDSGLYPGEVWKDSNGFLHIK